MKKCMLLPMIFVLLVLSAGLSTASIFPATGWGPAVEDYLDDYFPSYYQITSPSKFKGLWNYTALAYEAENVNITKEKYGGGGNDVTFSTRDTSNFGTWDLMNFDLDILKFKDNTDGPAKNVNSLNKTYFKYFMVDQTTTLDYLSGLVIESGSIIVGWNDNKNNQNNDSDYDDIIVAFTPVPEPASLALFGIGLLGVAAIYRKRKIAT